MTVCFTGHRQISGQYYDYSNNAVTVWTSVFTKTVELIHILINQGHKDFISGGALGFDQLAARAVIFLKSQGHDIKLWMALPFPGFEGKWLAKSKTELVRIVGNADHLHYVCDGDYAPWKMQKRNEWMVDNSQKAVALYLPDKPGGTLNCIRYIMTKYKPFTTIHPLTVATTECTWDVNAKQYVGVAGGT